MKKSKPEVVRLFSEEELIESLKQNQTQKTQSASVRYWQGKDHHHTSPIKTKATSDKSKQNKPVEVIDNDLEDEEQFLRVEWCSDVRGLGLVRNFLCEEDAEDIYNQVMESEWKAA